MQSIKYESNVIFSNQMKELWYC